MEMKWTSEIIIIFLLDLLVLLRRWLHLPLSPSLTLYRLIMIMNGPVYTFGGHNFYSNWYGNSRARASQRMSDGKSVHNGDRRRQKETAAKPKEPEKEHTPATTKHHVRENFQELTIINRDQRHQIRMYGITKVSSPPPPPPAPEVAVAAFLASTEDDTVK